VVPRRALPSPTATRRRQRRVDRLGALRQVPDLGQGRQDLPDELLGAVAGQAGADAQRDRELRIADTGRGPQSSRRSQAVLAAVSRLGRRSPGVEDGEKSSPPGAAPDPIGA
jgi:hypothetical protein